MLNVHILSAKSKYLEWLVIDVFNLIIFSKMLYGFLDFGKLLVVMVFM